MKLRSISLAAMLFCAFAATQAYPQKARIKPAAKAAPVVFAVLNDGKVIEPIGYAEKGKLAQAIDNATEAARISAFHRLYYKPASTYRLVFGGADAGSVTVKSADPKAECIANSAQIGFTSTRAKLKGNVMALATNLAPKGSGVRRLPTAAERSEIEALVHSEFEARKFSALVAKNLKYHNLTALDVDGDGTAEFVGTYWVETDPKARALLFFIAGKGTSGKYAIQFTDFRPIEEKDVMGGEISMVDDGVYHERLLDILDLDNDGVAEIFTYVQSFEGAGFNAYRRTGETWSNIYEGANYHCAF